MENGYMRHDTWERIHGACVHVQVLDRTIRVDYKIPAKPKVSDACINFLGKMLVGDPAKRITVKEIYEHPWFKQGFPAAVSPLSIHPHLTTFLHR